MSRIYQKLIGGQGITIKGGTVDSDLVSSAIDYAFVTANDGATDVTAVELETLTDGSNADALHSHAGGSGDVVGPAGATDEAIARYDTATGKLLQDSKCFISDTGDLTIGDGTAGKDFILNWVGEDSSADIIWREDQVRFDIRPDNALEVYIAANEMSFNNGATDSGLGWATSGRLDFTIGGTIEMFLQADSLSFETGGSDPGISWDENGKFKITVAGNDEFIVEPTGITIGRAAAGVDYTLTVDGETNDGVITWKEDEDYWLFSDDVWIEAGNRLAWSATNYILDTAGVVTSYFASVGHTYSINGTNEVTMTAGNVQFTNKISHAGDSNTYIEFTTDSIDVYSGGDHHLSFSTPSFSPVCQLNPSQEDIDIQLSGDTITYLLYTNAGTDRVGINTNGPSYLLDVNGIFRTQRCALRGGIYCGVATTSQVHSVAELAVEFDSDPVIDTDDYTHSVAANKEQITVDNTGTYMISFHVSFDNQGYTNRTVHRCWVEDDGAEIPGTICYDYLRYSTYGDWGTCAASKVVADITAASVLEVHCEFKKSTGAFGATDANIDTVANACAITIERIA